MKMYQGSSYRNCRRPSSCPARCLQHRERLREPLVERLQLPVGRRSGPWPCRRRARRWSACRVQNRSATQQQQQQEQDADDGGAHPDRIERPRFADGDQRPDPPDERRQREDADQREEQRMEQELPDLLRCRGPQALAAGTIRVISTRRLRARPAGVAFVSTGSASALPSALSARAFTCASASSALTASARSCERCQFDGIAQRADRLVVGVAGDQDGARRGVQRLGDAARAAAWSGRRSRSCRARRSRRP